LIEVSELIQRFSALPDWQSRYRHLIALGDQLPPFPLTEKKDENLVLGCESKIWLTHLHHHGNHHFLLESEAKIIRGLLAILWLALEGQPTQYITQFDFSDYFQQLGLAQHLTPSRSNGLQKVIAVMQSCTVRHHLETSKFL
jgi:cysteine desulfuration protein SufE